MKLLLVSLSLVLAFAFPADAVTLTFFCIEGTAADCATAPQYTVEVTDPGGGKVRFEFHHSGPSPSTIADVYFDDGSLLGIATIEDSDGAGTGVVFQAPATPGDLPGGAGIDPPFQTSIVPGQWFSADADPPAPAKGVSAGEWVAIIFSLKTGGTFADVIDELTGGTLRLGIHVQTFAGGGSASFVSNPVPEPATMFLMGAGLLGIGIWARKRLAKRQQSVITAA